MMTTLRSRFQNRTNQDGFTLIEMSVTTLIVGILASIGFPLVLANNGASGHDDSVRANLPHYAVAMAEYRIDHGLTSSASIHATAFKAVKHSDGNHFAVVSQGGPAYCVLGYSEAGTHTKADPIVITESNVSGSASCSLPYDANTLDWN